VRVLSAVFRGKFMEGVRQTAGRGGWTFAGKLAALKEASVFAAWCKHLGHTDWVVYAKPPFGGPEQVLKYLARYTHRVAISNGRLLDVGADVTFRTKDYTDGGRAKTLRLSGEEFLRRFSQHLLPRGFVKIRHYGLLANHGRKDRLEACRRLLLALTVVAAPKSAGPGEEIKPADSACCPHCGGVRFARWPLPKYCGLDLAAAPSGGRTLPEGTRASVEESRDTS